MTLIYIAHPFGGEQENVEKVEKIIKGLLHKHPNCTFYSPLHATGFFYFEVSYEEGMEHCFEALSRCDELWLTGKWRNSKGCNLEVKFAREHGIPVKELNDDGIGIYQAKILLAERLNSKSANSMPTIKEEPIKARWKGTGFGDYYCSYCNETVTGRPITCPNCWAEMEEN